MRKILIVLMPLLLTACVDDSASYYADGPVGNHALTIHRMQKHFWRKEATVELIMQRLPDCLRRVELTEMPADEVEIELFSGGDNVWTLRAEPVFLSPSYRGDFGTEFRQFRDLAVDGFFTDFPDAAARALAPR